MLKKAQHVSPAYNNRLLCLFEGCGKYKHIILIKLCGVSAVVDADLGVIFKMKNLILIALIFFFAGCKTGGNWTATELSDWYIGIQESDSNFLSPLYYQGTDQYYRY